jgi:hypothetical protein
MAGTFTSTSRPTQPGSYTDFIDETNATITPSQAQTVAVGGTHTWGPYNTPTLCTSYEDFVTKFGAGEDDLRRAVLQCFIGEGVGGKGGAGGVIVLRMGRAGIIAAATGSLTSSASFTAKTTSTSEILTEVSSFTGLSVGDAITGTGIPSASTIEELIPGKEEIKLNHKATASGAAVTMTATIEALSFTAAYPGSFGNGVSLTVQAGAVEHTQQLLVLSGGAVVERYTFFTNITGFLTKLAEQVNSVSRFIGVTVTNDNAPLVAITAHALTGGNDGTSITSADYSTAYAALANEAFSVCSFANLTDSSITASAVAWAESSNHTGKRFTLVLGGLVGESATTAETAASTINNENVIRVGVGTITDTGNISPGTPINLSTAQFAPRVAGVVANRGEKRDLVMARFFGVNLSSDAPQTAEIAAAPAAGLTVFSSDGRQDAPVRIAQGCTTFTQPTSANDPRNPARFTNGTNVYGVVKYVRIMQGIETDLLKWQEQGDGVLGELDVTLRSAATLVGYAKGEIIGKRISAGILQAASTAFLDESTFGPFSEDNDFIPIMYGAKFSPSLRQVFNSVAVNI